MPLHGASEFSHVETEVIPLERGGDFDLDLEVRRRVVSRRWCAGCARWCLCVGIDGIVNWMRTHATHNVRSSP